MLVHPSAVNSLVLVGSLGLGSAAAPKGSIRERRLLQKKDLLSPSGGAPPFNEKNRRGDGRPGRRKEIRAKIAELKSESSTEEIPAVDTGVIGHEAVAAPVASKLDVGFVDCVLGYVRDDFGGVTCEEACDGNCCVGYNACQYFTGHVAKDGSCDGDYACWAAVIGEVSGPSCVGVGRYPCLTTYAQSITDSSCIGEEACLGLNSYQGERPNVSDGSCVGYKACLFAGHFGAFGPSISASCKGDNSCHYAGFYFYGYIPDAYNSGSVGDLVGSCNGDSACKDMGKNGSVGNVMNGCNGKGTCQSVAAGRDQSVSAIIDCCNAPPDGICAGVESNDGLVAADPTCKAGVNLADTLALIEEESESDTSPFTEKQLCYGKTAVENTVASLSKGHSTAAVRYGVNKAFDDLGCDDKSDSEIYLLQKLPNERYGVHDDAVLRSAPPAPLVHPRPLPLPRHRLLDRVLHKHVVDLLRAEPLHRRGAPSRAAFVPPAGPALQPPAPLGLGPPPPGLPRLPRAPDVRAQDLADAPFRDVREVLPPVPPGGPGTVEPERPVRERTQELLGRGEERDAPALPEPVVDPAGHPDPVRRGGGVVADRVVVRHCRRCVSACQCVSVCSREGRQGRAHESHDSRGRS
ncbi:hypothetical protein THAOC_16271 [Thalassiosira oceanica]|uniref:DUF7640 domain-containing protein n=1 Tax=Thalassiosira oceanica TaxID=159749 RepID=K0SXY0_THAOC|nr:hypothetical protein THAOC_16271 [Thalassiosira oceanica]|eukprot:EJK63092.1 hypothetical protein THAOC_16271 [Thalassiosira oceanica]